MAIVIKPKRSETADSAPGTSDIVDGEIAVNIADKKIFIRHSDDSIVTLSDGANLTSGSTSTIDATTDIILDADGGDIGDKYQELYDTIIHIHSSIMPWRMKRTTKSIR